MYAKDISKKIRAALKIKQETGQFIGTYAPYGYIKDQNNKNKLLIDDEVAHVVKRIYEMYLSGKGAVAIAELLNDEGVESPSAYKKRVLPKYKPTRTKLFLWSGDSIKLILQNPTYCGNLTQHKQHKVSYKMDKKKGIPAKEWVTATGTHEGIVSGADFENVQLIMGKRANYSKKGKRTRLLSGLLFCKECGGKMTYRGRENNHTVLCSAYSRFGLRACHSNTMREDIVEKYVIDELRKIAKQTLSANFNERFNSMKPTGNERTDEEIKAGKKKIDEIRQIIKNLYIDKLKGIIDESILLEVSSQYSAELRQIQRRLAELEQQKENPVTEVDYKELIRQIANFDVPDKSILLKLINKIEISKDKQVFISYNFKNPCISA